MSEIKYEVGVRACIGVMKDRAYLLLKKSLKKERALERAPMITDVKHPEFIRLTKD